MYKYYYLFFVLLITSLSFSSCSRKTITFYGDSSLYASNQFHPEPAQSISFSILKKSEVKSKEFLLKEGRYQNIYTKEPILFSPSELMLGWRRAYPGDTVSVSENEYAAIIYTSGNRRRDLELFCCHLLDSLYVTVNKEILGPYYDGDTLSAPAIRERVNTLTGRKHLLLDSVAGQYLLSDRQFLYAKHDEIRADSLSTTYWLSDKFIRPVSDRQEWLKICRQFSHELGGMKMEKMSSIYFRRCADQLYGIIEKERRDTRALSSTTDFIQCSDLINDYFTGAMRDYLLSGLMYNTVSKRIGIPDTYVKSYFRRCSDKRYRMEIKEKMKEKRQLERIQTTTGGNDLLAIENKKVTTIEALICKEKGNIILIDFWASWCVPCREEFPLLRKLEDAYKGRGVRFIKISFDREIEKWERASRDEGFMKDNYVLLDFRKSEMVAKYGISTIPRFMLIGRNGEVIESNAPSPGDEGLRVLIERWLNN